MRNSKINSAEIYLKEAKQTLLEIAKEEQQTCLHTTVHQYNWICHSMRICPSCGLEEWASHWSGIGDYWTRRDFKPGDLDDKDGRRIKLVDQLEFYKYRIETQPIPNYNK